MVVGAKYLCVVGIVVGWVSGPISACADSHVQPVKNVIVLIADGCSSEQYTLARWFQGKPLALDEILVGGVKTYIADSVIADSAPPPRRLLRVCGPATTLSASVPSRALCGPTWNRPPTCSIVRWRPCWKEHDCKARPRAS